MRCLGALQASADDNPLAPADGKKAVAAQSRGDSRLFGIRERCCAGLQALMMLGWAHGPAAAGGFRTCCFCRIFSVVVRISRMI